MNRSELLISTHWSLLEFPIGAFVAHPQDERSELTSFFLSCLLACFLAFLLACLLALFVCLFVCLFPDLSTDQAQLYRWEIMGVKLVFQRWHSSPGKLVGRACDMWLMMDQEVQQNWPDFFPLQLDSFMKFCKIKAPKLPKLSDSTHSGGIPTSNRPEVSNWSWLLGSKVNKAISGTLHTKNPYKAVADMAETTRRYLCYVQHLPPS